MAGQKEITTKVCWWGDDMRNLMLLMMSVVFAFGVGCVKMQDTPYVPQSMARGSGEITLGSFSYDAPSDRQHDIKCPLTWYQFNSELTVAEYIKRANYLELKNCGYNVVGGAKIVISAIIKEIIVNDFGFGADIKYIVEYSIAQDGMVEHFNFAMERKGVAKGSNYAVAINSMIREGVERLLSRLK